MIQVWRHEVITTVLIKRLTRRFVIFQFVMSVTLYRDVKLRKYFEFFSNKFVCVRK